MAFNSVIFIFIFLPLVLVSYFFIPKKLKNLFLVLASTAFYGWENIEHIKILFFSILINYIIGIGISYFKNKQKNRIYSKIVLILGILINVSLLSYYKYFNFFVELMNSFTNIEISKKNIILPLGISFFTFKALSYIIDVYMNKVQASNSVVDVALYMSFFPQIVCGPIAKYEDMQFQLKNHNVDLINFYNGINRFIIGLAKKVIISGVLGEVANNIFGSWRNGIDIPTAWLGIICYSFQLYYDFSGYSDIAIGIGNLFGFTTCENFNFPYISKSISEFWRRWHISLSNWFREYIYIPLGGNRKGNVYINLLVVFLATGLWHGASYNFILWGLYHGFFIVLDKKIYKIKVYSQVPIIVKRLGTFLIVLIGWVMFRMDGLTNTLDYYKSMFIFDQSKYVDFSFAFFFNRRTAFFLALAIIGSTPLISLIYNKVVNNRCMQVFKFFVVIALFILSIIFIVNGTYNPFIYFQF